MEPKELRCRFFGHRFCPSSFQRVIPYEACSKFCHCISAKVYFANNRFLLFLTVNVHRARKMFLEFIGYPTRECSISCFIGAHDVSLQPESSSGSSLYGLLAGSETPYCLQ